MIRFWWPSPYFQGHYIVKTLKVSIMCTFYAPSFEKVGGLGVCVWGGGGEGGGGGSVLLLACPFVHYVPSFITLVHSLRFLVHRVTLEPCMLNVLNMDSS